MAWLKRLLFGWRLALPVEGRRLAIPVIATLLLLCCGGTFGAALLDSSLRQAGVLPTYTPAPPRACAPAASSTKSLPAKSCWPNGAAWTLTTRPSSAPSSNAWPR